MASNITGFRGYYYISCPSPFSLSFIARQAKMAPGSSWLTLYTVLVAREPTKMRTSASTFVPAKVLERTSVDLVWVILSQVITVTREKREYSGLPWLIYLFLGIQGVMSAPLRPDGKDLIPKEVLSRWKARFFSSVCVLFHVLNWTLQLLWWDWIECW